MQDAAADCSIPPVAVATLVVVWGSPPTNDLDKHACCSDDVDDVGISALITHEQTARTLHASGKGEGGSSR